MVLTPKLLQARKCKYCDEPAKKNIYRGRNKGYYRTCGSEKCLTEQYRDKAVNARKACNKPTFCKKCDGFFIARSPRQKWCLTCAPERKYAAILWRYGLSFKEYMKLKSENNGICPICETAEKSVVDHNHSTGEVRGMLCNSCNVGLHVIEHKEKSERAYRYLEGNGSICQ